MTTMLKRSGGISKAISRWIDQHRSKERLSRTPRRNKPSPAAVPSRGLDRTSPEWRAAVGPGYAVGVTEAVLEIVAQASDDQ